MDIFGFSALWEFMQRWRGLFQQFDRDRSGFISGTELHQGTLVCVLKMLQLSWIWNHFVNKNDHNRVVQ